MEMYGFTLAVFIATMHLRQIAYLFNSGCVYTFICLQSLLHDMFSCLSGFN